MPSPRQQELSKWWTVELREAEGLRSTCTLDNIAATFFGTHGCVAAFATVLTIFNQIILPDVIPRKLLDFFLLVIWSRSIKDTLLAYMYLLAQIIIPTSSHKRFALIFHAPHFDIPCQSLHVLTLLNLETLRLRESVCGTCS